MYNLENFSEKRRLKLLVPRFGHSLPKMAENIVYKSSIRLNFVADGKLQLPKLGHAVLLLGDCGHFSIYVKAPVITSRK